MSAWRSLGVLGGPWRLPCLLGGGLVCLGVLGGPWRSSARFCSQRLASTHVLQLPAPSAHNCRWKQAGGALKLDSAPAPYFDAPMRATVAGSMLGR